MYLKAKKLTRGNEDHERERDTTNSGALRRLGRSSETDKWRYKVLPDIIQQSWESLVKRFQHFDSELEQRCFEPEARQPEVHFLHPWAVFCRAEMYSQHHVTSHNANANGWKGCQKLCLGRK